MSTINHLRTAPRISFCALQHFRIKKPFFSLSLLKKASESFCYWTQRLHPRVWLPTRWRSFTFPSLGSFFSPQHSWASPFRAFFLSRGQKNLNESFFPLWHFLTKLYSSLVLVLQRLCPPRKAVFLFATQWIRSSRKHMLSWAF
jgi:hypothetical protein